VSETPTSLGGRTLVNRRSTRLIKATYIAAAGLGSALLFMIEPLAVRLLLPSLGGTPAVWITALVFFQFALLLGYLAAHMVRTRVPWKVRSWALVGLVGAGFAFLPVVLPSGWQPPSTSIAPWVMGALGVMLGLPFVGLATLSPTLQSWFSDTNHPQREEPYFLYAAGNVGSAVGLLSYPFLLEPNLGLNTQSVLWTLGYGILLVLLTVCAGLRHRYRSAVPKVVPAAAKADVSSSDRFRWVLLAAVPSALLLAVTQHISTDIAAIPLLWVVPLALYLGSFVVAFAKPTSGPSRNLRLAALASPIFMVSVMLTPAHSTRWLFVAIVTSLTAFTFLSLAINFELAARRPPISDLTEYFLWISVGGLVGGVLVAIAAPIVFRSVVELPILLVAALMIITAPKEMPIPSIRRILVPTVAVLAGFLFVLGGLQENPIWLAVAIVGALLLLYALRKHMPTFAAFLIGAILLASLVTPGSTLHQDRSFFGVLRVSDSEGVHSLAHGSTIHGSQQFAPEISLQPTTYYQTDSGVGRLMTALTAGGNARKMGIVGLGTGTLAVYGRDIDQIDFYEIDQKVVEIAENPDFFTFLADSASVVEISVVDGRLGLAASLGGYDMIVLDAFSSDSIPVHLLTKEAFEIYVDKLNPDGVLAVHVSNRHFDLEPVVQNVAADQGLSTSVLTTDGSKWLAVYSATASGPAVAEATEWSAATHKDALVWTDDYADVLSALNGF
jgi:spermidine synthase